MSLKFHKNHHQNEHIVGTQLFLASATMPTNTEEVFRSIIDPDTLKVIASDDLHKILPHVQQKYVNKFLTTFFYTWLLIIDL